MRNGKSILAVAITAAATAAGAVSANASIVYSYVTYTGAPQETFTTVAGTPVQISIYLDEALSGSPSLITADGGLYAAAFSVTQQTTNSGVATMSLAGEPSSYSSIDAATVSSTEQRLAEDNNTTISGPDPTSGEVLIGVATITPASAGSDTYVLTDYGLSGLTTTAGTGPGAEQPFGNFDLDASNADTADGGEYTYAGASNNPETFTVIATPEPATLGLAMIGSLGLLARRRRREA